MERHGTLAALEQELGSVREALLAAEHDAQALIAQTTPSWRDGARNLVDYVALRRRDLREVQGRLATLGLSSLGRAEAHVMPTLDAVLGVLRALRGHGALRVDASDALAASERKARIIGILLLVMAVAAGFAELGVRSALVVPGDAARTAARLLASPGRFLLGFGGYLVAFLLDVPVAILFYSLLKSAGRTSALVAASFRIVYAAIAATNLLNYLGALSVLTGGLSSESDWARRQELALFRLEAYDHGFKLALVLFGVHLLILGVLLFKSGLLPKTFGTLIVLGGCAYLADSISSFANPALHSAIAPYLAALASLEIVLALWFVVRGVRRS